MTVAPSFICRGAAASARSMASSVCANAPVEATSSPRAIRAMRFIRSPPVQPTRLHDCRLVGESWCEHSGEERGVPDILSRHPLVGLAHQVTAAIALQERAEPPPCNGRVQLHFRAIEAGGRACEVISREVRLALAAGNR